MKIFLVSFLLLNFIQLSSASELTTYFNRDCEKALINEINKANKNIKVAVFSFTRFSIARALIKARQRKVNVEIIVDYHQANTEYGNKIYELLSQNKINVCLIKKSEGSHMHHKFTVVDDAVIVNGSFNYTTNAVKFSDENLIVIKDRKVASEFNQQWELLKKRKSTD